MSELKPILELKNISKHFIQGNSKIEVLKNINLIINPGEFISIIGTSGSGKSTLMYIAGLLDFANEGQVIINGNNFSKELNQTKFNFARLYHLGFVYQNYNLLKDFNVLENVLMPALIAGSDVKLTKQYALILLEQLKLTHRLKNLPGELSGGEQQRVSIARALINKPKLLLADEPIGNLDPNTGMSVFLMLLDIVKHQNTSILMVTHNYEITKQMHRNFELRFGELYQT